MPADLSSLSMARSALLSPNGFLNAFVGRSLYADCAAFAVEAQKKRLTIFFLPSPESSAKSINKEINYCFSNSTTAANNEKKNGELFYAENKQKLFFFAERVNMKVLQGN